MTIGYTDQPILNINNDSFDVKIYIDGLCDFIRSCGTPMTIAIQGDWGSGKTSMMNLIQENLKNDVVPLWFNTWKYSQFDLQDKLVYSMLSQLMNDLLPDKKKAAAFGEKLSKIARAFAIGAIGHFSEAGANKVDELLSITNMSQEIDAIRNSFQNAVNESLTARQKDRVVVFIDDLDRLQPQKAVELLEVLKLFLDCDNCVFVLAVDYEVISQGVKVKFGTAVQEEKGKSFFDKIIQLPFKMPVAQYNIKKFMVDMLQGIGIVNLPDSELSLMEKLIRFSIGFNPRSMKRLFNSFQLLVTIIRKRHDANASGDLTHQHKRMIFAILCMQLVYDDLYSYIIQNVDNLNKEFFDQITPEDAKSNKELSRIYVDLDLLSIDTMQRFISLFVMCMQLDANDELDDKEINNLRSLLLFSTLTSVGEMKTADDDNLRYTIRRNNRGLVKDLNEVILKRYRQKRLDLKVYQSNGDSENYKTTYASGYKTTDFSDAPPWRFEYQLRHDMNKGIFSICLYVCAHKDISPDELASMCTSKGLAIVRKAIEWNSRVYLVDETRELEGDYLKFYNESRSVLLPYLDALLA